MRVGNETTMTTITRYVGQILQDSASLFDADFGSADERAAGMMAALLANHDEVEPHEIETAIAGIEDPSEQLNAVVPLYTSYARVSVHCFEVEVALPDHLYVTATVTGDDLVVEAHVDPEDRRQALIERCTNLLPGEVLVRADAASMALAADLALLLGPGARVGLAALSLSTQEPTSWQPSISEPGLMSKDRTELIVMTTEYGDGGRSMTAHTSAPRAISEMTDRLGEIFDEVPANGSFDHVAETLASALARTSGGTLHVDRLTLDDGVWVLGD